MKQLINFFESSKKKKAFHKKILGKSATITVFPSIFFMNICKLSFLLTKNDHEINCNKQ